MSGFDIIGAVAAAEQFAEVVFKTIKLVKSVVDQIHDAPDQIQQQIGRLESLTSLAKQVQNTKTLQNEEINKILTRCESHLQSLQNLLHKISFGGDDPLGKKTWRAICSLKEEGAMLKLFDMLDQEYNSLNTHIHLRTYAMAENLQAGYHSIDTKLNAIAQAADSSPDTLKCLQALFITDPAMDRATLITSKGELVHGTCDWIAQKNEFIEWKASDGGLLWISGGPGLGKTMLSMYLTEYLSSGFGSLEDEKRHYSTYFFCDAKDNTRNNAVAIVRGLLFQLLEHKKELIGHILPSYQVQKEQLFQQNSFETLWRFFLEMINDLRESEVACILDGLDECEPVSLDPMLTKLKKMASTSPRLKMIILSREYPQCIGASLGQFLRIRLDPDAKTEVSDGLNQYISTRVAELSENKHYPAKLTNHVKEILREKSAGTYLWVSFVVKDLQTMEISEVEESLDQFPRGLDALYERILEQVEPARRDLTLDILRWCTFAVRPLAFDEIATALGIQPTELLDRATVLRGKLAYCGHFLSIANDAVTLVHQSAYDFLTSRVSYSGTIPWFSLSHVELEHSKLASTCISYVYSRYFGDEDILHGESILNGEREKPRYPFLHYAGYQWVDHFNHSGQQGVKILDEYPKFFSNKSQVWKAWNLWRFGRIYDREHDGLAPVAARFGLTVLMQRILKEEGTWLYLKDSFAILTGRALLHIAAENGHLPIVEMLIKNKARIDIKDDWGYTPLHYAARNEQLSAVEMLIKNKARINIKDNWGYTPLHHAARNGQLSAVEILVNNGARVDAENRLNKTPLCLAVEGGHAKIAESLLMCGANVNGIDPACAPLVRAVKSDKPELMKLLLEWGADARTRDRDGWSPLGKKLYNQPATLSIFLEDWAKRFCTTPARFRDMVDFGETTALHIACGGEDLPAIRLLLDPKWSLDLNYQDKEGNTPLHMAASNGRLEAVELLLTQPSADPTLVNKMSLSPVHLALIYRQTAVVEYLVEKWNISLPEPHENCGWSAIHLVALHHHYISQFWERIDTSKRVEEILQFLVGELGVDPQLRTPKAKCIDDKWHSHHFINFNYESCCSLTKSDHFPPQDFCYETPLSLAIRGGCVSAMEYFLARCNTDPNAPCRGCDGASPLHVAAQSLRSDIVDILISKWKANVDCVDDYQRTPLHSVAGALPDDSSKQRLAKRNETIQVLITAGAQISPIDSNGHTPRDLFISCKSFIGTWGKMGRGHEFDKIIRYVNGQLINDY